MFPKKKLTALSFLHLSHFVSFLLLLASSSYDNRKTQTAVKWRCHKTSASNPVDPRRPHVQCRQN